MHVERVPCLWGTTLWCMSEDRSIHFFLWAILLLSLFFGTAYLECECLLRQRCSRFDSPWHDRLRNSSTFFRSLADADTSSYECNFIQLNKFDPTGISVRYGLYFNVGKRAFNVHFRKRIALCFAKSTFPTGCQLTRVLLNVTMPCRSSTRRPRPDRPNNSE